jgi:hypothetical protein
MNHIGILPPKLNLFYNIFLKYFYIFFYNKRPQENNIPTAL